MEPISYQQFDDRLTLFDIAVDQLDKIYCDLLHKTTIEYSEVKSFRDMYYITKDYIGPDLVRGIIGFHYDFDAEVKQLVLLTFGKNFRYPL